MKIFKKLSLFLLVLVGCAATLSAQERLSYSEKAAQKANNADTTLQGLRTQRSTLEAQLRAKYPAFKPGSTKGFNQKFFDKLSADPLFQELESVNQQIASEENSPANQKETQEAQAAQACPNC